MTRALAQSRISVCLSTLMLCVLAGVAEAQGSRPAPWVELIEIDGSINPAVTDYIEDALGSAGRRGAEALVIELDTPGGLLSSAQRIVKDILGAPIPVIVYVAPSGASAASAGMFITIAANIAAMAPGTAIGAAHPVEAGGADLKGAMAEKIENFTASFAKTVAAQRGRNEKWVEDSVRHSAAMSERDALDKHVIDIIAVNLSDLLAQADGREVTVAGAKRALDLRGATVHRRKMKLGQRLLNALADPNVVYLLLMGGMLGLYFEFAHPGVFLPGVAGAICLVLAFASFQVLPINLAGLLLLFLGVAMLISEAFVTSFGIMGLGGVVAFVIGSLFMIDSSQTSLEVSRSMIAGAAVAFTAAIVVTAYLIARDTMAPATTGSEGLIGEIGEVRERVAPNQAGRLQVRGELWRAVGNETIETGERARVTGVSGLALEVRRQPLKEDT